MNNQYSPLLDTLRDLPKAGKDARLRFEPKSFTLPLAAETLFDALVINPNGLFNSSDADPRNAPFEITYRHPVVDLYAPPEGWQWVGLWLLHFLFSDRDWAGLRLTHPRNRQMTHLYVCCERVGSRLYGLKAAAPLGYSAYTYWPHQVNRNLLANLERKSDWPGIYFSWSDEEARRNRWRSQVDQLVVRTTPEGLCILASVLLDFGRNDNDQNEIDVESHLVDRASIAARFWLPGSFGFRETTLDELYYLEPHENITV
jgi:hypothetical protein